MMERLGRGRDLYLRAVAVFAFSICGDLTRTKAMRHPKSRQVHKLLYRVAVRLPRLSIGEWS